MPILRRHVDVFDNDQLADVRRIHRWAVLFGVVSPLVLLLVVVAKTHAVLNVWPTLLHLTFEHLLLYGWAGVYAFGLISYLIPQVVDQPVEEKDKRRLAMAFLSYGLGLGAIGVQAIAHYIRIPILGSQVLALAGALLQALALMVWQYQAIIWFGHARNTVSILQTMRSIGILFLTAGGLLYLVLAVMRLITGQPFLGVGMQLALRLLPVVGIGLITLGLLLRMVPELLGWRPLDEGIIRRISKFLLIFGVISAAGEPIFHQLMSAFGALIYLGSAAAVFACVAGLLISMDLFHARLSPLVNREHIPYIYASLAWLLISTGMYLVMAVFEVRNGISHVAWSESVSIGYVGGFIAMALLGIYTYWINQQPGAYQHTDRLAMFAFVFLQWVLVLRIFVYPLALSSSWDGMFAFRWVLDAFFIIGIALVSLDMYDGLLGHVWHAPWRGKHLR